MCLCRCVRIPAAAVLALRPLYAESTIWMAMLMRLDNQLCVFVAARQATRLPCFAGCPHAPLCCHEYCAAYHPCCRVPSSVPCPLWYGMPLLQRDLARVAAAIATQLQTQPLGQCCPLQNELKKGKVFIQSLTFELSSGRRGPAGRVLVGVASRIKGANLGLMRALVGVPEPCLDACPVWLDVCPRMVYI